MSAVIVLVDPDADGRAILKTYLAHHGYTVHDSADGEAALELVRRHRPALIIGDFPMDVPGHSPFTGAVRRELGQECPVLTVTTRATPEQLKAARAVSRTVLVKPVRPNRVLKAVRAILEHP